MTNVQKFEAMMSRTFSYSTKTLTPSQVKDTAKSLAASAGLTKQEFNSSLDENIK